MNFFYFAKKIFRTGYVTNVKWHEEPGYAMLNHQWYCQK